MKLYFSKGACSLAVRILVHELEMECEFESVNLKTKKTEFDEDFIKINPKGSVPVLITEKGKLLTENAVIQQYLAEKFHAEHLLPLPGNFRRYRVLEWLNFVSTDLHKNFSPIFNPRVADEMKKQIFLPLLQAKFEFVDKNLQHHRYLTGDTFTLPDTYLFVLIRWANSVGPDLSECKNLLRYFAGVSERGTVQKALAEEGLT